MGMLSSVQAGMTSAWPSYMCMCLGLPVCVRQCVPSRPQTGCPPALLQASLKAALHAAGFSKPDIVADTPVEMNIKPGQTNLPDHVQPRRLLFQATR